MSRVSAEPRYEIRKECICCAACWKMVPEHFGSHDIHAHAIIVRQPETAAEFDRCEQARRVCPVNAIEAQSKEAS